MKRSLLTVGAQHGAAQQGLQPPQAPELGRNGKKMLRSMRAAQVHGAQRQLQHFQ
ncbi:hypothetical protein [Xanthomonas graminis]|uniref:hypothetical protein n=1 Tax=Xanthomonas graminis TaxID=3390026 RepID=UPI001364A36F|nr:hypothetical protein [Xanthomonas translucens]UKE52928.1 hypothetical protein KFS84_10785 [Xanthomonas translucens pv. graminis]WIH10184.1 hypothetical protein KM579_09650 [Xanthomonas translucens pv. graminis]WIH13584.1 hypothetical protein KM563_08060 [Xanthomonas translucens pv. graminis]WIH14737.1 hypothetical protein KM433_12065 [Xanthomonas translucens pv. graminis]